MTEVLIVLGIAGLIAARAYGAGKRTYSRKGYGAGRAHARRRRR